MHMVLCQQLYSLMHDPAVGIIIFIDAIHSIVQQLGVGHKPDDLKISNKLLIGLHKSWAPICTALLLCEKSEKSEIEKITSVLKQFEANKLLVAVPGPPVKIEQPELSLAELALYSKSQRGGSKKGHGMKSGEIDWGNMNVSDKLEEDRKGTDVMTEVYHESYLNYSVQMDTLKGHTLGRCSQMLKGSPGQTED